ncbi:ArnT family glycosyltransferase [Radiobacillus deserti]|uniref:Glycosyltransferase family 39 protein n=1 Tax=Radiobacillus deserti TaxID=2594883 RepID=A0A516KJQ1_9BACI|nr:glycosyltransferase family 39 protein [Radiobacillus deserti]QDP41616.1 glycosyltransferase family 39 protein [Radiobacillus deserti]
MNKRILRFLQSSKLYIGIILLIAFGLRLGVFLYYGWDLSIGSDDTGYVRSAKTLLDTGMLTYHKPNDTPTVHIMPGQPLFLAAIFLIFGTGAIGTIAGKIIFILLGVGCVYFVYLIGKYVGNVWIGLMTALMLACFLPQILTDNLFLTETPFMFCFIAMIYYSLRLANERTWKNFYLLMAFYLLAVLFKATIALFPFLLLFYFVIKKYPIKLAIKQLGVAAIILVVVLGPWWVRNYIQFGDFIPLTGGAGNPLLLGTYQGEGYLYGETYEDTVIKISKEHPDANAYEHLQYQYDAAIERMEMWHNKDSDSFWRSYLQLKPQMQWDGQFYWKEIYSVTKEFMDRIHNRIVDLALLSLLAVPFMKGKRKEYLFLIGFILYNTIFNSIYYAYDRYNQPLMFILFLGIATAIYLLAHGAYRLAKRLLQRNSPENSI